MGELGGKRENDGICGRDDEKRSGHKPTRVDKKYFEQKRPH